MEVKPLRAMFYKTIAVTFLLQSCQEVPPQNPQNGDMKSRWNSKNEPTLMLSGDEAYNFEFKKLPLSGMLARKPWSGDYWRSQYGGISYRWNMKVEDNVKKFSYPLAKEDEIAGLKMEELSPSEKYDIYVGRYDFPLTKYERNRTDVLKTVEGSDEFEKDFKIPEWEGLCHAWAPATLEYKEPKAVELIGANGVKVPFGSADIKALLTSFVDISETNDTEFLGTRCETDLVELKRKLRDKVITKKEYNKEKKACLDTHAGAFHVVLANQVGLLKEGFIADVDKGPEVWNQSIFGYESIVVSEKDGASPKAAKGTVKEITLKTTMFYTDELENTWDRSKEDSKGTKLYNYRVELNDAGEVIGGEWLDEKEDRPDFLWKQKVPEFSGFFKDLETIYKASIKDLDEKNKIVRNKMVAHSRDAQHD